MKELRPNMFAPFALALPRGHGFGSRPPVFAWLGETERAWGCVRKDSADGSFGVLVVRRRVDDVWTVVSDDHGFASFDAAKAAVSDRLKDGDPPEPLPPGERRRDSLRRIEGKELSPSFQSILRPTHTGAAWLLNQLYLSLPKPDANWVSDCQTSNFHTRLWEAQLLGSFREQGILVAQPVESPDFHLNNRAGDEAWVEAVTANPAVPYNHVNAKPMLAPADKEDLFFGAAAERFAKTIGNKLQRRYADLPHVAGKPFALAVADFQAGASMVWSRSSLLGYLYGEGARLNRRGGKATPEVFTAQALKGAAAFPAGLFTDERASELSAVIFTNACSIAKLNRYMITRGAPTAGRRVVRFGEFFDRRPKAYEDVPFRMDVASEEYRRLWPQQAEPLSAEMEVFHNPFARHPLPFAIVPEATHWFDSGGETLCQPYYETSILHSMTFLEDASKPMEPLDVFLERLKNVAEGRAGAPPIN